MTKTLCFIANILLIGVVISTSVTPAVAQEQPNNNPSKPTADHSIYLPLIVTDLPTIIPATTKVLSTATESEIIAISSDQSIITFDQWTDELQGLRPGDVIVGDVTPITPQGFLRKVTLVTSSGGDVRVATTQTTLPEAIQQGSFQYSAQLIPASSTNKVFLNGVKPVASTESVSPNIFTYELSDVILYDNDNNLATVEDQIRVSGSISFEPIVDVRYEIQNFRLHKFNYTLTGKNSIDVSYESGVGMEALPESISNVKIAQIAGHATPVLIGPVTFWITPIAEIYVGGDGMVSIGFTNSVARETEWNGNISYTRADGWETAGDASSSYTWTEPTLTSHMGFIGRTGFQLNFLVNGVPGFYSNVSPFVQLDGGWDWTRNIGWTLSAGTDISLGAKTEILGDDRTDVEKLVFTEADVLDKTPLPPPSPYVNSISVGGGHTCAITPSGTLKCWGEGVAGQLGNGGNQNQVTPTYVDGLDPEIVDVAAGGTSTCAVTATGTVKCWGFNSYSYPQYSPTAVPGLSSDVVKLATSGYHFCAVMRLGGVKCWGINDAGQLGNERFDTTKDWIEITPVDVLGLTESVVDISASGFFTCALTASGGVKCWGSNEYGQLGDGTLINRDVPVDVVGLFSGATAITTDYDHACAILTGGRVKCWGRGIAGQLGDGTNQNHSTPAFVAGITDAVDVVAGHERTCAVKSTGEILCWGKNNDGFLGNENIGLIQSVPVVVQGITSTTKQLALGGGHFCAMMQAGNIICFGYNGSGQLGNGGPLSYDYTPPGNVINWP